MSNKVYVGNLSFNTMEDSIREEFTKYGEVSSCNLVTDKDTGRSKGFAFVEMGSDESAQDAIANLNGREMDGRCMRVNEAKPQEKRERSSGGSRW